MKSMSLSNSATRNFKLYILAILGMLSISCSGGGGGSDTQPSNEKPGITVSGAAIKGPIDGGVVTAFALDTNGNIGSQLGSDTTVSDGSFSIDIGNYTGNVLIEVKGGTYTDEATANPNVSNDATLRVALVNVSGNVSAYVTPLTEIAVRIATDVLNRQTTTNIISASALVSNLIGGADIVSTVPANMLDGSAANVEIGEQLYGLMLAAISQIVEDPNAYGNVTEAITAIASDLKDDKTLDITGEDLAAAITNFDSGLQTDDQFKALISAYSESTIPDTGFSVDDLVGTWRLAGLVTPIKNSSFNYRAVELVEIGLFNDDTYTLTCLFRSGEECDPPVPESGSGFSITPDGFIPALDPDPGQASYTYMSVGKAVTATLDVDENQELSIAVKRADSYSVADLEGSWMNVSIYTPLDGGSNTDHGFGIGQLDFADDGSGASSCIASNYGCDVPETFSGLNIGDGLFYVDNAPGETDVLAISADKNLMVEVSERLDELFMSIHVRKANSFSTAELAGTWKRIAFKTPLDTDNDSIATGDYGFDVGTLIINPDGSLTYNCIDTSDSDGCSTIFGTMPGVGVCNITYPLPATGESECGVVSAGKDIIVNLIVNSDSEEQELSILLKRGDLAGSVETSYNFTDYFVPDTQVGCSATYQYVAGDNIGNQFIHTVTDTYDVNYTSGSLPGIEIESRDDVDTLLDTYIVYKDATTVRYLGYNGYYFAKDCDFSAPSPYLSFSNVHDGMIIDQTAMQHQVNVSNPSDCVSGLGSQKLLIKVQDLTDPPGDYQDAIIMYYLDTDYPFHDPIVPLAVMDYGLTLPTAFDTGGYSITAYDIYAANIGQIAGGNVAAETGTFFDPYELVSSSCPSQP